MDFFLGVVVVECVVNARGGECGAEEFVAAGSGLLRQEAEELIKTIEYVRKAENAVEL